MYVIGSATDFPSQFKNNDILSTLSIQSNTKNIQSVEDTKINRLARIKTKLGKNITNKEQTRNLLGMKFGTNTSKSNPNPNHGETDFVSMQYQSQTPFSFTRFQYMYIFFLRNFYI